MNNDESWVRYAVNLEEILLRIYKPDADDGTNHLAIRLLAKQSVRHSDERYLSLARQIDSTCAENYEEAYEFLMGRRTEDRKIQQSDYDYINTTQVKLKLNNETDKDILAWINTQRMNPDTSIQGEIKRLIRKEIERKN